MLALRALSLSTLLGAALATVPALALPCPPETVAVDVGVQELAFADDGQGGFVGVGSGATIAVRPAGLDLLATGVGEVGDAADIALRFDGATLAPRPVEGEAGVAVNRLDAVGASPAIGWRQIETLGLYPGVDLVISATNRRVNASLEADSAQALGAVRLVAPGAGIGLRNPDTLTLSADVLPGTGPAAGSRRTFEVEMAAFEGSGDEERRLEARFVLDRTPTGENAVGFDFADAMGGPIRVELTSLLAPHVPAVDTERLADGGSLALTPARLLAGDARRAALVTRFDRDGAAVESTVVDAGTDVAVAGLAVDLSGRLVLVGESRKGESPSAWLALADLERGELQSIPAEGLDAAEDAVVDAAGRVLVVGRTAAELTVSRELAGDLVLAVPRLEEEATETLVVAELAADRLSPSLAVPVSRRLSRLRAWVDCHGQIHFGTPFFETQRSTQHTYAIGVSASDMQNCPRIDESHGFGALCWKARKNVPNWTYHPWNVQSSDIPSALVFLRDPTDPNATGENDHERLDKAEANQYGNLFYDTTQSAWADPGGSWTHPLNWAYSKAELAVAAAIYHERWTSPVFANLRVTDGVSQTPGLRAVMLREETFSAASQSQLPHEICDEDSDQDGTPDFEQKSWPPFLEIDAARNCVNAHGSSFTLESILYDTWRVGTAYVPNQTLQGSAAGWWPFYTPFIGDPPIPGAEDPSYSAAYLREIFRRVGERARVPAEIEVTEVVGGQVVSTKTVSADIPASAID